MGVTAVQSPSGKCKRMTIFEMDIMILGIMKN